MEMFELNSSISRYSTYHLYYLDSSYILETGGSQGDGILAVKNDKLHNDQRLVETTNATINPKLKELENRLRIRIF